MELRGNMQGSTTLVASVVTKDRAAPEFGAGRKDPGAETVGTDFTAARPSVDLQSRTPPARILAPLADTSMGAPRAATRIGVPRACMAAAFMEAGTVE